MHSSLKVPPMPLPAEQFLQPLLPCPSSLQSFTALQARGGHRHFHSRDKYSAISAATSVGDDTQTPAQGTGSWEAAPHGAFPPAVLCNRRKSLFPATVCGAHPKVPANPSTKQESHFSIQEKGDCRQNHLGKPPSMQLQPTKVTK